MNGDAAERVEAAGDADQVLGLAGQAVLRAEQRRQGHARCSRDQVGGVAEPRIDGGRVGDEADAPAAQGGELLLGQAVEAGANGGGHGRSLGRRFFRSGVSSPSGGFFFWNNFATPKAAAAKAPTAPPTMPPRMAPCRAPDSGSFACSANSSNR